MQTNTEQTNTMDKLCYTPVLSKKFPSFAGVATRSEFIKVVIESLWIMIPLVILNGLMSFVKSDEAVMVLSLLSCLLTIVGVVLSFARKWIHTFVKRVHAIGKSYTKIYLYPQIAIFVLYGIGLGWFAVVGMFGLFGLQLFGLVLVGVALLCSLVYNIYALYIFIKCFSYTSIDKKEKDDNKSYCLSSKTKCWLCISSFTLFLVSIIALIVAEHAYSSSLFCFGGNQKNYLMAAAIVQFCVACVVIVLGVIGGRYSKQAVIWNLLGGIVSIPLLITVLSCSQTTFKNSAANELIYYEIVIYIVSLIRGGLYLLNAHSNKEVVVVSDNGEKSCVNRNDSLTSKEEKTHLVDTKLMMLAAMKGDKSYFVDLLRHQGSDILNTQDDLGNTVLITAARFNQTELINLFVVMGVDLEQKNKIGATALFVAAEKGFENCVNSLLQAGANVNAVTTGGRTSLMAAVQGEYVGCAKSLLIHGADANVTNSDGMSARDYAQMSENEQIRNLFSE